MNAIAICDRCGFKYDKNRLAEQIFDQKPTGLMVCSDCMDIDHEQLRIKELVFDDPRILQDVRPDTNADRSFSGWNPVVGEELTFTMGTVRVTVT